MKCIDPSTMAREQRLAELGELLAAGIQRHLARGSKAPQNQREQLAAPGRVEAPCGATPKVPA
jgi:hypothetical protein